MMKHLALLPAVLAMGLLAAPAQADSFSVDFGPVSSDVNGVDFTFNLVVPTVIIGDGTLTLTLDGDFNTSSEYADVILDGLLIGRILDDDTGNDPFNFANGDDPDASSSAGDPDTGSATISNAILAPRIADGLLVLQINTSSTVNFSTTTVSGTLSFKTVPEPTCLALLCGALGTILLRRRRRTAA